MGATAEVQETVTEDEEIHELDTALETLEKGGTEDELSEEEDTETGGDEEEETVSEDTQTGDKDADKGTEEKATEEETAKITETENRLIGENRQLKQMLRQTKQDMTVLQAKINRIDKRPAVAAKPSKTDEEDIFGEAAETEKTAEETVEELSDVELLALEIAQIGQEKSGLFSLIVNQMAMNDDTKDVVEVCSKDNFADIFEAIADNMVAEDPMKDKAATMLAVEASVWRMPNPYEYMYGVIKRHHPAYASTEEKTTTKPDVKDTKVKTEKKPKAVAKTVVDKGAGAKGTGWTAAQIDILPEDKLDKVPAEIYAKYMADELD